MKERHSHIFFEKTTEIFFSKTKVIRNVLQGDLFAEMFLHIIYDLFYPVYAEAVCCSDMGCGMCGKIPDQMSQHLHDNPFGFQKKGRGVFYIKPCQFLHHLTYLEIIRKLIVCQFIWNTVNLIQVNIMQITLHIFSGNVGTDEHGRIRVSICAVHQTGINYGQMLAGNLIFFSFNLYSGFTVQLVEKFDLLVPVKWVISAGSCAVCKPDPQVIDLLKCFIKRMLHI